MSVCPLVAMDAFMSPALTIFLLVCVLLIVAGAMLWGLMRISRHHHPQVQPKAKDSREKPTASAINAH